MPVRKLTTALITVAMVPLHVSADTSSIWQGSYEANGQCFCSGPVSETISSKIVPTPIGGQTVQQVCAKVGAGPGLTQEDGLFNHTVYKDMQCGNGPFASSSVSHDVDCLGSNDGTYGSCQPAGPKWDLEAAYASPVAIAAATPEDSVVKAETDVADLKLTDDDSTETSMPVLVEQKIDVAANNAANFNSDIEENVVASVVPNSFAGKSVTIGDHRYLQAKDDLPATGGEPGSRIILDGLVFLKEDENLKPSDLYVLPKTQKPTQVASEKATAPKQIEKVESVAANTKDSTLNIADPKIASAYSDDAYSDDNARQKFLDAMEADRNAKAEQQDKEKLLEAQLVKEQKRLAAAKIESQKQLAEQQALEQKQLAQKQALIQQQLAEQNAIEQKALEDRTLAEQREKQESIRREQVAAQKRKAVTDAQAAAAKKSKAVAEVARQVKDSDAELATTGLATVLSALQMPANTRASSRNFNYFEAMPTSYDFGGTGVRLEGSLQQNNRFQFLGSVATSDAYGEVMLGAGYFLTPKSASRLTVALLAGVESGSFELTNEQVAPGLVVTTSDTGLYLGAMSRVVINNKFELKGGMGYSTFFGGDASIFGGGYYHVTPRLDVMSRFEIGDNDNLGLGIRYYY